MLSPAIVLKTSHGPLQTMLFQDSLKRECVVVYKVSNDLPPFVRIQSSCLFSESFGSADCDCALQLDASLKLLSKDGGYLFYTYEEGRGAGLMAKIRGIHIEQTRSISTAEAYAELGLQPDCRNYSTVIAAMQALRLPKAIRMASNNPEKEKAVSDAGFNVVEIVQLDFEKNETIDTYLKNKQRFLGHRGQ